MSKRNKIIVAILLVVSILVAAKEIYSFVRGLTAEYPDNDLNGYIAWGAGGATDTTSRGITVQAQKFLGSNIVMQNKTGATGAIATEFVYRLPADGYSLLYNAENPTLYHVMDISNIDYEEFYPVLLFGSQVAVVIVPPDSKYQSIKDVIEDAAANPGKIELELIEVQTGS
ncbi:MAG: tripartite tricarboxylate transporter substrate-binding protein, partial [Oscillospiraceae bacterium]|nr:tripartite tricarboxylate transporter substrate-binding protein [Oscillospiraceae bacterium]